MEYIFGFAEECGLWLRGFVRIIGFCLLPRARLCEYLASIAARKVPHLRSYTWHIAVGFLGCVLVILVAVCSLIAICLYDNMRSTASPCVCKVSERSASQRHVVLTITVGVLLPRFEQPLLACLSHCMQRCLPFSMLPTLCGTNHEAPL